MRGLRARLPSNSVEKLMRSIAADGLGVTVLRDNASIESGKTGIGVGVKFGSTVCVGRGVELIKMRVAEAVTEAAAVAPGP